MKHKDYSEDGQQYFQNSKNGNKPIFVINSVFAKKKQQHPYQEAGSAPNNKNTFKELITAQQPFNQKQDRPFSVQNFINKESDQKARSKKKEINNSYQFQINLDKINFYHPQRKQGKSQENTRRIYQSSPYNPNLQVKAPEFRTQALAELKQQVHEAVGELEYQKLEMAQLMYKLSAIRQKQFGKISKAMRKSAKTDWEVELNFLEMKLDGYKKIHKGGEGSIKYENEEESLQAKSLIVDEKEKEIKENSNNLEIKQANKEKVAALLEQSNLLSNQKKIESENLRLQESVQILQDRVKEESTKNEIKSLEINRFKQEVELLKASQNQYFQMQLEVEKKKKELEQKLNEFDKVREENIKLKLSQQDCGFKMKINKKILNCSDQAIQCDNNKQTQKRNEEQQQQLEQVTISSIQFNDGEENKTKNGKENKIKQENVSLQNQTNLLKEQQKQNNKSENQEIGDSSIYKNSFEIDQNFQSPKSGEDNNSRSKFEFNANEQMTNRSDTKKISENLLSKKDYSDSPNQQQFKRRPIIQEENYLKQIEEFKRNILQLNQKIREQQRNIPQPGELDKLKNEVILLQREKEAQRQFYEQQLFELRQQILQEIRQNEKYNSQFKQMKKSQKMQNNI